MPRFAHFHQQIVPFEDARIPIDTFALHYGLGQFSGIRGYWNREAQVLFLFRPLDHLERLLSTGKLLQLDLPGSAEDLLACIVRLLTAEKLEGDVYCRSVAYKSSGPIGAKLHGVPSDFCSYVLPMGRLAQPEKGLRLCVSSWRRVQDSAIPARGKICGSYVNNALAKSEAIANGFDDALLLCDDGRVSEATSANVFLVKNGTLITPTETDNILVGITRRTILELAAEKWSLPVEIRPISRSELYCSDEVFLCGTGIEIAGVSEIDRRPIGCGTVGPITTQIRDEYFRIVRGHHPTVHSAWRVPVRYSNGDVKYTNG